MGGHRPRRRCGAVDLVSGGEVPECAAAGGGTLTGCAAHRLLATCGRGDPPDHGAARPGAGLGIPAGGPDPASARHPPPKKVRQEVQHLIETATFATPDKDRPTQVLILLDLLRRLDYPDMDGITDDLTNGFDMVGKRTDGR